MSNMLMLGMLGEYIWRALDASRNRPPYLIDEVKNGNEAIKENRTVVEEKKRDKK